MVVTWWELVEDAAVPAQKLEDNGVSVLVVVWGPALSGGTREARSRDFPDPRGSLRDLSHHQDALIEWICRGEWGIRNFRVASEGWTSARAFCGHPYMDSSSQLLGTSMCRALC